MKIVALWRQWASRLRLEVLTLYFAYRNPRTPWFAKLWAAIVVAYAFSPVDLIPDFIPILGYLDDLVLIPVGIAVAAKLIPKDILEESKNLARQRIDSKKPVNWIAGSVVIAIWVALLAFVVYRLVLLQRDKPSGR
jgi:uncharacterized membrane protein YkvA (DUF1232 family)